MYRVYWGVWYTQIVSFLPGGGLDAVWAAAGMRFADGEVAPSQTLLNEVGPLSPAGALAPTRKKDLNLSPLSACSLNDEDWKWCAFRCEGTAKMGGCTHGFVLPVPIAQLRHAYVAALTAQVPAHVG